MVFKEHPAFKAPKNEDTKIWRYMDFAKYVSLLETNSLHFTRIDRLDDKFEGAVPNSYYLSKRTSQLVKKQLPKAYERLSSQGRIQPDTAIGQARRKWAFVNCWHMNNTESVAMWKLYLKSNEGVAIQTTYRKLREVVKKCRYPIWIGEVEYIDYENGKMPTDNSNRRFISKRTAFEYEQELRAVIRKYPIPERDLKNGLVTPAELAEAAKIYPKGLKIPVDLSALVQKVYVCPFAEQWFVNLVNAVTEKYGLEKEVEKSPLSQKPTY